MWGRLNTGIIGLILGLYSNVCMETKEGLIEINHLFTRIFIHDLEQENIEFDDNKEAEV